MAGNREAWRPIAGHDGYEVSDRGRVRSPRKTLKLTTKRDKPYLFVKIRAKCYRVHMLVMLAFVGPRPEGMEVRHGDGNARNNRLGNLGWATHSDNLRDQKRHGRRRPASTTKHRAKVAEVHRLRAEGVSASEIARRLRMNESTVRNIYMGRRWKHFIPAVA